MNIDEADISVRLYNTLKERGISNLEQIRQFSSIDEIEKIKSRSFIGTRTAQELLEIMALNNIIFSSKKQVFTREEAMAIGLNSYNLRTTDKEVRSTNSYKEWFNLQY